MLLWFTLLLYCSLTSFPPKSMKDTSFISYLFSYLFYGYMLPFEKTRELILIQVSNYHVSEDCKKDFIAVLSCAK